MMKNKLNFEIFNNLFKTFKHVCILYILYLKYMKK